MRSLQALAFGMILLGCPLFTGCQKDNPGLWQVDRVSAKIVERFELTDISLNPKDGGGFEGTGKTAAGETFTFDITQEPDNSKMSWNATSDRGTIEDGFYELK